MSEHKGFLFADGSVRKKEQGSIGEVRYQETRHNLRRVLVTREWRVHLHHLPPSAWVGGSDRRREAIAVALRVYAQDLRDGDVLPGDEQGPCETCGKPCDLSWGPECDDCDRADG